MSFLDIYLKQNQLSPVSEDVKKRLEKVESNLDTLIQNENTFDVVIRDYAGQINLVIEEIKRKFENWSFNFQNVVSAFRFVIDISEEATSIIGEISDRITPVNGTDSTTLRNIQIQFGQQLVYFVYILWNPNLFQWTPSIIKDLIEKKIIFWLSGMVIDYFLDQLEKK